MKSIQGFMLLFSCWYDPRELGGMGNYCDVNGMDCKCMEFVAGGLYIRKLFRLNQTIRNLWYRDLIIPLGVFRLGVTR